MFFLSYSREDRNHAARLAAELLESNVAFYRDPPAPTGDAFWRDQIKEQLSAAGALIVLWSKNARRSPWVDQEIRAFCGRVVVIVLDATPWPYADRPTRSIFDKKSVLSTVGRSSGRHEIGWRPPGIEQEQLCEEEIEKQRRELTRWNRKELERFSREASRPARLTPLGDGTLTRNECDGSVLRRITARDGRSICVATEPVTNFQYSRFVKATGFPLPPTARREEFYQPAQPVVGVNWFEASAYAAWVGGVLPTEDEWTLAATCCNASSDFATEPGVMSPTLAHYDRPFAGGSPVAAKCFAPTAGGFFNLCGNTWDWCSSRDASYCVIKGGGFMDTAEFCAIHARYRNAPLDRDCTVGFRIAVR